MFAVESKMQIKNKVGLTVEEAFNTHMEETHWLADARLVRAFMDKSASTIDWLENLGVRYTGLFAISPHTPRVWHQLEGFGKEGLIKPLYEKAVADKKIRIFLETPVKSLVMEEGRAAGVAAEDKDGETVRAKSKVVVIASGGYQDNKEWVERYCKSGFISPMVPSKQTGGPIQMAWDIGAEPHDLGVMQSFVYVSGEELNSQLLVAGVQPHLWINQLGERFTNESLCWKFPLAGNALARQPKELAYCIFDEKTKNYMKEKGIQFVYGELFDILGKLSDIDNEIKRGEKEGKVFQGSTLKELAEKIEVDVATFQSTVEEYNACCDKNYDFIFGKNRKSLQNIKEPKFYAIKLTLAAFMTNGGIKINHKTEVLNKQHKAIPGLYAAGCCAGGLLGDTYEVSTTGGSLGFAVNSGRMAGENALKYLGK